MKKGWQTKSLGDVLVKTETNDPTRLPDAEFDYIDVSSISNETLTIQETQRLKGKDAPSRARRHVRTNDVLLATVRPTLRRIAIVPEELDEQICSTGYFVLRAKPEVDFRFIFYFLQTEVFMAAMERLQKGASYPAVTDGNVRSQPIPVPSLSEQQRIVGLLDEAFASLATAQAHAAQNLQNARALFECCIQVELGKDVALGELVDIKTGKLDANAAEEDGEYPFFTCSRETYAINNYAFDCEAVLLAGNNAVGDFNVKHYVGKFNAYQRTYVITINSKKRAISRYLYFQLQKNLQKFKSQSVGTGTKFLKLGMIKDMMIPLPTIPEQSRIVNQLDALAAETQRLAQIYEQKLAALAALKKSILHQAFSGEL